LKTVAEKLKIQIVVGSVREGRVSLPVAQWVLASANERDGLEAELIDLVDWALPMFALRTSPAMGDYKDPLQQRWAAKIGEGDGYIFVSPEYNHGPSAALKNALDYLYAEWNRKPVAFVSFGNAGGARAVEQLRSIAIELEMAPLGDAVHLYGVRDKLKAGHFEADTKDKRQLTQLFDSMVWWGKALQAARRAG
jgi:NAD(P)H-dependent FMN reductase